MIAVSIPLVRIMSSDHKVLLKCLSVFDFKGQANMLFEHNFGTDQIASPK